MSRMLYVVLPANIVQLKLLAGGEEFVGVVFLFK